MEKTRESVEGSRWQCGGRSGRSTRDNWMILGAVMDNNKRMGKNTYVVMADAEKCFEKLWLEDCLVHMAEREK